MGENRVSMPMGSAGIIGFSPDMKISGVEVEPKILIAMIVIVVVIVVAANFVVR
ncbi:preprotein translocase subunit Sec61beta [Candidatus Micrarchaeota archaeon]|nr:preprotein translocase subunit Sec61beta [Candidatus Micrarchaeota archaeon]